MKLIQQVWNRALELPHEIQSTRAWPSGCTPTTWPERQMPIGPSMESSRKRRNSREYSITMICINSALTSYHTVERKMLINLPSPITVVHATWHTGTWCVGVGPSWAAKTEWWVWIHWKCIILTHTSILFKKIWLYQSYIFDALLWLIWIKKKVCVC